MSRRIRRITAVWPSAPDRTYESTDHARVRYLARQWATAGATATVEEDAGGWKWRHVKTYEPPAPVDDVDQAEQQPVAETAPQAVEDELALYERIMRQAPTGRDNRGRVACRHIVGRRGIR
ncbi:hypothetical protein PH213_16935 [Streptomyces sp. SRF1]|uniref:hypothetical protein n=1 Tax=Streptomyces sp. SRF1 TaxID=1549642 RepID=UPI0025B13DB9|nr:hypothetical protein [Streptomyces sp. SRF1]MDN3056201.1 hypothetical protein [Streptomyces sp. SRF1]